MSSQDVRPKWWQVYLTFPLLVSLFMVDARLKLTARAHQVLQIGILLLVYGLVHAWLKANASAISKMDHRQHHGTVTVMRVPAHPLQAAHRPRQPLLQLGNSELKGILNDTIEMGFIDAEFIPMEKALDDMKKE